MWPYWALFVVSSLAAIAIRPGGVQGRAPQRLDGITFVYFLFALLIAVMIGFRFEVGGDWINYLEGLPLIGETPLLEVLKLSDPAYQVLSWVSYRLGWDVYGVNFVGGLIFAAGLATFCSALPRPWLAIAVAVPYLIIVVGMGYSRQAVALGLSLVGLVALQRGSNVKFAAWIVFGAAFHKTALLLLPIAALANAKNRYMAALWVGVTGAAAYPLLLEDSVEAFYVNYVEAGYQSEGALIRLMMNAFPAAILLIWRRRFGLNTAAERLWIWFAMISVALLGAFFLTDASTAVDRVALYMLPLQLMVFSHLPGVFTARNAANRGVVAMVLMYYAAVQYVWLNFATHADFWVPYRSYLFT